MTRTVEILDLDLTPLEHVGKGWPFITVRRVGLFVEATRWKDGKPQLTARRLTAFAALRAIRAHRHPAWWVPGGTGRHLL